MDDLDSQLEALTNEKEEVRFVTFLALPPIHLPSITNSISVIVAVIIVDVIIGVVFFISRFVTLLFLFPSVSAPRWRLNVKIKRKR